LLSVSAYSCTRCQRRLLPFLDRADGEQRVGVLEVPGRDQVDDGGIELEAREVRLPLEVRRERLRVRGGDAVEQLLRVAEVDGAVGTLRELGLERHHHFGVARGVGLRFPEQRQHVRDVRLVVLAQRDRLVVGAQVVVLLRQAHAVLGHEQDVHRRILEVRVRPGAEERWLTPIACGCASKAPAASGRARQRVDALRAPRRAASPPWASIAFSSMPVA
jgi:hypothetical protein